MNNDLKAVMARQRRVADGEKTDGTNEMSIAELKAAGAVGKGKSKKEREREKAEEAKAKANDLQAIMARRRRLADGEKEEKPPEVVKEPEKPKEPKKDPLKEIMDRRRRIADGEKEAPPPPEPPKPEVPKAAAPEKNSLQEIMQRRRRAAEPPPPEPEPPKPPEPETPRSPEPEKGSLQEIMQRRRKVADGEIPPPTSPTRAPLSPVKSGDVEKISLAPPNAGLSLAPPPSTRVSLAPPPRAATTVRQDLKQVGMSSEVQKIMERRRKMAEVTNFVDEDEDSDEDDEDKDTPASSPKVVQRKPPPPPPLARRPATQSAFGASMPPMQSQTSNPSAFSLKPAGAPDGSFSPRRAAPQSVSSFSFGAGLTPPMPSSPTRASSSSSFSLKPAGAPENKSPGKAPGSTFSLRPDSKPSVQVSSTSFSLRPESKPTVQAGGTTFSLKPQVRESESPAQQQPATFSLKPNEPELRPQPAQRQPEPIMEPESEEEEEEVFPPTPPPEPESPEDEEISAEPAFSPEKPKEDDSVSSETTPPKEREKSVTPKAPDFEPPDFDEYELEEDEEVESDGEEEEIESDGEEDEIEIPPPSVAKEEELSPPTPPVAVEREEPTTESESTLVHVAEPAPVAVAESTQAPVVESTPVLAAESLSVPAAESTSVPAVESAPKAPSESPSHPKLSSSSKQYRKDSSASEKHEKSSKSKKEKHVSAVVSTPIAEAGEPATVEPTEEKKKKKDKPNVEEPPPVVDEPEEEEEPDVKAEVEGEEDDSEEDDEDVSLDETPVEPALDETPVEPAPKSEEQDKPKPRKATRKKERRGLEDEEPPAETTEAPQAGKKQPKRKKRISKKLSSKGFEEEASKEVAKTPKETVEEPHLIKPTPSKQSTPEETPPTKPPAKQSTPEEAPSIKPPSRQSTPEEAPPTKTLAKQSTSEEGPPSKSPTKQATPEDAPPVKMPKQSAPEEVSAPKLPATKHPSNDNDKTTKPSLASALSGGSRRKGGDEKSVTSAHSNSSGGDLSKGSAQTDDISKAPLWDMRHEHPGGKADGKITVFQRDGKGLAAQWSTESQTWVEIGEVASIANDESPALAAVGKVRRKKGVEGPGVKQRRQKSYRIKGGSGDEGPRKGEEEFEEPEPEKEEVPPPPPPTRKKKAAAPSVASVETSDAGRMETNKTVQKSGFDQSGWGDVPAFGAEMNAGSSGDAFASGFFGDVGFQTNAAAPVAFSTDAFRGDTNFEDAFGSPSAFDPAAAGSLFAPIPQEPVYDTTPLTKMPCTSPGKIELDQRKVMRCRFQGNVSSNPLNGNVIISCEARDGAILREVDTTRGNLQVLSTAILSPELSAKVANKYNATVRGLDEVIRVSTGLHESNGLVRVRVAAILHLRVLETQQPLRIVAVYRWGHGFPHPVSLQYIVSPPSGGSGGDFSYDPTSILVADNLLFLAGQSPKGPCVFISKPSLRESWTSNSLSGSGKVSSMEVLLTPDRSRPYLAVALTDKSISVWTFRSAVEINPGKEQQTKRWLFPLCRLDCSKTLSSVEASSTNAEGAQTGTDAKNTGFCTHLSWLDSRVVGTSILFIAASYQNGLAVFHVGLPMLSDKSGVKPVPEPTSGSSLSQTPKILPIVAKRWQGKHDRCMASWVDMGPYVNPCLALLLQSSELKNTRLVFGIINIPQFRRGPRTKEKVLPFKVLADGLLTEKPPVFLLPSAGRGMIFCQSENHFYHVTPFVPENSSGTSISSLRHPICSQPPGISSLGEPLLEETKTDKDGIVHIFSTLQCERNKADSDGTVFDWSRPTRRHWICRTVVGDTKSSSVDEAKEEKATTQFGDGETVLGGAATDILCEICDDALCGSTPIRIIRSPGNDELYAVLFRPSLCSKNGCKEGISLCATNVAFIDRSEAATVIRVVSARDAVFFPRAPGDPPRGVILSSDGLRLTFFTWDPKRLECKLHTTYRPILGVEGDEEYIECKRVFVSSGASNVSLLAAGTRLRDLRTVVVSGELVEMSNFGPDDWTSLLPNIVTGRAAWLLSMEDIITLVGLEGDDSGYRNFSMVTSLRVLILSSAMEVAAECRTTMVESASLSPLGAFAVSFVSDGRVRYLCCLDGELSHGSIASLPSGVNRANPFLLLAVRQDRIIGTEAHVGIRLAEIGQKTDSVFLPSASTRPALLLEPLVANAVSIGGKQNQSTAILRNIIERFGRVVPLAHGESEGVGNLGSGLTSRVFQILGYYGLKHAASWLLTGTIQFDRSANTTLLPPWLPVTSRTRGALNMDAVLHILSNGDQYLSDYVKNPDGGLAATLPRLSDPVSYLSRDLAAESLLQGNAIDALKTLDMVGSESSESMIVQLSLLLEKDGTKDTNGILSLVSGYGEAGLGRSFGETRLPSSVAALVLSQKIARMRGVELIMNNGDIDRWMKPLAPSLQKGGRLRRNRQRLIGEKDLSKAGEIKESFDDPLWTTSCREAKHVWNEGPNREKGKLLMLDRIEDWVGRRRPVILGKEGASAARDRGALANILDMDENSFGGKSDIEDELDGWVDGVGEGRSDEANLSGYFRFSEGEDEEKAWRTDGLVDLSPYQIKATLFGEADAFSLKTSTSSVDEGEPGKVKSLFDLVFEKACAGALVTPAHRGGSLDIGALHTPDRQSRQRCTVEFWYHISSNKLPSNEMVLARRTLGAAAGDLSKVSALSDKEGMLWELAVKSSGEIVFRSCGGSTLRSTQKQEPEGDDEEKKPGSDLVQFGKWNHICLLLDSRGLGLTECNASILMMGNAVAGSKVSMLPSGFDEEDLDSSANLKELLQKSSILFGLNNPKEFRMTELRVWACTRSEDDVNTFMREYLNAAEGKKKFKVKIKSKKGATTLGKGNLLTKGGVGGSANAPKGMLSLAPTPKMSLAPQKKEGTEIPDQKSASIETGFATDFNAFGVSESASGSPHGSPEKVAEEEMPMTLWDTALPLSQQVRSSAAAALIRGPPATRHFGGNRGGLPDFSGMERFGVGGVAICGSEKTIVWRDNEDPPALTYPIGASGAIVSDQMDDEGSEFLCCFLARDKRMVVFELQSRTVVVELQMTTKLNFWRFLPPEAGENTLCFMLVTPVGGFHWMPLDESPRPQQVWKRGPDLAGKKVVSYEEGGSNGLDGPDILSRVGLIMVTKASGAETLECWIVPIAGDSVAVQVSEKVLGGCFCLPPYVDEGPFLPLLVTVLQIEEGIFVNVGYLTEPEQESVGIGEVAVTLEVDLADFEDVDYEPPSLAMGTFPEAICCSLANIVVVLLRRKGLIVAFELEDGDMSLIAREGVDHYVIDAVMRYSAEVGGAEIVMLLADDENPKDGRMVSFCFRSAE